MMVLSLDNAANFFLTSSNLPLQMSLYTSTLTLSFMRQSLNCPRSLMSNTINDWSLIPARLFEFIIESLNSKSLAGMRDQSLMVLDIRDRGQFNDWRINDSVNVDVYNDIWSGRFDEVRKKFAALSKDKTIITVCNAGVTSQNASMLQISS